MNPDNDCDLLAKSIIDRLFKPIKNNEEVQALSTVFFLLGIGIKDEMKKELVKNPERFLDNLQKSEWNQVIKKNKQLHDDINKDILYFSQCCQNYKK